jgi:hypothetical protein
LRTFCGAEPLAPGDKPLAPIGDNQKMAAEGHFAV